jgi:hypothetical protein
MPDERPEVATTERLARALEERQNPRLDGMIRKARAGAYDDYLSESPTPINDLVRDLVQNGEHELAGRAMRGEFDGTREEAQAWANSPEGEDVFREFGRRP